MVQTLSLVGAAFAVGGSYFAVDSLRDILLAKTINTSYATRIAIAGAATLAGLAMISNAAASQSRKTTKNLLSKQLMSAESFSPNQWDWKRVIMNLKGDEELECSVCNTKLKIHKGVNSEDPTHIFSNWISCSNCHYKIGMDSGEWLHGGNDIITCGICDKRLRESELDENDNGTWCCPYCGDGEYPSFEDLNNPRKVFFTEDSQDFDAEAYDHRTERAWSGMLSNAPGDAVVNQVDLFHDKHILAHDDAHRAAQSWLRKNEKAQFNEIHYMLYQIDAGKWGMEYLALDTMDAEELTFHDWSEQEMMNHGKDDSFDDWVEHEIDSHGNKSLRDWADDEGESHTKRYGHSRPRGAFTARDAESDDPSDMTCHYCEKEAKDMGMVTWPNGLAACDQCFDEMMEERAAESKRYTRRPIDRFTRKPKAKAGAYRGRGRRSALKSMFGSEDDDDTDLVPDREPRRGAPDLWFAETKDDSKKTFPPIFKKATTGKIQEWRIRTEKLPDGNWAYISSHGQLGGSMVEGKGTVIKAGKQGRTVEEQANAEAAAKWKKKKETGYFESADAANNNVVVLPMTALNFKKRAHDINWPAIGQPKLDGVRCLARLEADGTVSLTSRKNKLFPGMDHIREELATRLKSLGNSEGSPFPSNIVIDGELYADPEELTFQQSTGLVRRNNKTPEDLANEKKLKLNVYDCINLDDLDMDFIDRYNLVSSNLSNMDSIAIVDNTTLSDTDAVDPLHDQFVKDGYEGLMIRNVKGPYKLNGKSKHLQKYKSFQDDEFEIVGYTEGKGDYVGTVIWICETSDGKKFRVKPNGTHAQRSKLFDEADSHIGKQITVRFFELTDDGIPRFPTGGWFRDYEAESFDAEAPHYHGDCDDCKQPMMLGKEIKNRSGVSTLTSSKICQECDEVVCGSCHSQAKVCPHCDESFNAEVFEAFSISDRPVSVSFGKGTSGNAKMKAVFTDGSGDTKTTQFGYKGMSDYTKHGDEKRKSSYLARHGAKSSGQKWNDPTTAGSLSRWVLWNKKSLSESKKSFKNKFNLGAEGNYESPIEEEGYQQSIFITEAGRRSVWAYEPDYSITEDSL